MEHPTGRDVRLRTGSGIPNDMTMFRHPVLELSHDRGRFTKNVRDELHAYDTGGASSDVSAYTSTLHSTFPRSWQSNWVVREKKAVRTGSDIGCSRGVTSDTASG